MIFISYAHNKDEEKVNKTFDILNESFFNKVFMDKKKINFGQDYWDPINLGINTSKIFIYFNSDKYFASRSCQAELFRALNCLMNKEISKIIEIKLDDTPTPPSIEKTVLYAKWNENTPNEIIKGIKTGDFKGFEKYKNLNIIFNENEKFLDIIPNFEVIQKMNITTIASNKECKPTFAFSGMFNNHNNEIEINNKNYYIKTISTNLVLCPKEHLSIPVSIKEYPILYIINSLPDNDSIFFLLKPNTNFINNPETIKDINNITEWINKKPDNY